MPVIAPNTPKTSWIRDSGVVIEATTDVLVDELGNLFVDEFGNNLLDSVSTDNGDSNISWSELADNNTNWAVSTESLSEIANRVTESGDVRVTMLGSNLTSIIISNNKKLPNSWSITVENTTSWADAFDIISTFSRVLANGNSRTTNQGDTRISNTSDNKKETTTWSEDEY